MTDRHLDDAIDRAVREMMSVDAPEQVKVRVLARLASTAWPIPWFRVAALTSLAAAALAAFVMLPSREGDTAHQRVDEPARVPMVASVPPTIRTPRPEERVRVHVQSRASVPVERADGVTAAHVDAHDALPFEIDPLATLHPIVIAPIEHGSIGPANLALTPLAPIPEVRVEPLSPRGERN